MIKNFIVCLCLYIIGYGLLIYFNNWQTAFAIFVIHWANNIETTLKKNIDNRVRFV